MTRRRRRMVIIGAALCVLGAAVALILSAMEDTLLYFRAPADVLAETVPEGQRFRLGGLVKVESVVRTGETIRFLVTDFAADVPVIYTGILPDLFREGQGVVTEGALDASGTFVASTVLARHDETYMPPEVAEALKKAGTWNPYDPKQAAEATP